jgi:hypothetical protein
MQIVRTVTQRDLKSFQFKIASLADPKNFGHSFDKANSHLPWLQGDQIGRIFAQWAIIYYGQFLENYRCSPHFWVTFSPFKAMH